MRELLPSLPDYTLEDYLNDRKANHKEYDIKKDAAAIPAVTIRHKDAKQIIEAETAAEPETLGTISFSERKKRKEAVDRALYEFIRKAGGEDEK